MSVSPEQQLRAYVEYFRDLGVYELYQRESPQVGMPERWRALLARPKPPAAAPAHQTKLVSALVPATPAEAPQNNFAAAQAQRASAESVAV